MTNEISNYDLPALEKIREEVNERMGGNFLKSPSEVVTYLIGYYQGSQRKI